MTEQLGNRPMVVNEALAQLNEGERRLLDARYLDDGVKNSYKKVGEIMGMSASTARKAVLRAESQLRAMRQGPHSSRA